jgi:mono/diheme cytochrome c family protein
MGTRIRIARWLTCAVALAASSLLAAHAQQPIPKRTHAAGESRPDLLYHNYCSVCHGDKGDGRSRARASLVPPPRDFTEPAALQSLTRDTMIAIVTHGKPGTAMTGWTTQLSTTDIEALVDYVIATFMAPRRTPAFMRGRDVYAQTCVACHGSRGEGATHGPMAMRDLTTPQARVELSRERMIGTASSDAHRRTMGQSAGRLGADDLAAAVDFIRVEFMATQTASVSGTQAHGGRANEVPKAIAPTAAMDLPFPKGLRGNAARGRAFYEANCATCHGVKGDAQGPRAYFINPKPRDFLTETSRQTFNRPALFAAISVGRVGAEMPAWNKVLNDQQIADVSEYVFTAFIRQDTQRVAGARRR